MENQKENRRKIEGTMSLEVFIREARNNPFEYFEKCPIEEIRTACLKVLEDQFEVFLPQAEWAEKIIPNLLKKNDRLAGRLISWYLFNSKRPVFAMRALGFVIQKVDYPLHKKSKLIHSRFKNCENSMRDYYDQMPFLKDFLGKLLVEIKPADDYIGGDFEYCESDWRCAFRAILMILSVKDYSFLPQIDELIELLKTGNTKPDKNSFSDSDGFTAYSHLTNLEFASMTLNIAKNTKNLSGK